MKTKIFSQADILRQFDLTRMVEALRTALVQVSRGEAISPPRLVHQVETKPFQALGLMAGIDGKSFGAKVTAVSAKLRGSEEDCHQGIVALFDRESGMLEALGDGATITALRTAVVSCVASLALAAKQSSNLVIFGVGLQARLHALFLAQLFPLRRIDILSPHASERLALAEELQDLVTAEVYSGGEEDIAQCFPHMICTLTSAARILPIKAAPGCHINAVGASTLQQKELSPTLLAASRVYVETQAAARHSAGDLVGFDLDKTQEIGTVVNGHAHDSGSCSIFKSVGLGLMDVAFLQELVRASSHDEIPEIEFGRKHDTFAYFKERYRRQM